MYLARFIFILQGSTGKSIEVINLLDSDDAEISQNHDLVPTPQKNIESRYRAPTKVDVCFFVESYLLYADFDFYKKKVFFRKVAKLKF